MPLVLDRRTQVAGPGVHAFVVGVSDYVNLPAHDDIPRKETWFLSKLTSGSLSAFTTYETLLKDQLRLPIKTIRLLLSPSTVELAANPAIATAGAQKATRAAFQADALDWRDDARKDPSGITFFYFAGHGMQRGPEEGVLLLEDFLAPGPPLARCAEVGDIKAGMAPTDGFPNIALTQFYFVDACLDRNAMQKEFVSPEVPDVFGAELNLNDQREAPLMFSTVDGALAISRVGKPSHFAEALTTALESAAEDPEDDPNGGTRWPVTSITLKTAMDAYYARQKLGTKVKLGGLVGVPVIRYLPAAPEVEVALKVQPDQLGNGYGVWLFDENDSAVPSCDPASKTEISIKVKAGLYRVQVDSAQLQNGPYRSPRRFITQRGPWPWLHNLGPYLKPV